jgi:lantibiotic modifying enzyme
MQVKPYPTELVKENSSSLRKEILHHIGMMEHAIQTGTTHNDSLFMGKLGLSLYHYSCFEYTGSEEHIEKGRLHLDEVFLRFNESGSSLLNPSLSTGLAGFMSLLNFLSKKQYIYQDLQEFEEIDKFLLKQALHQADHDFNDYLHGSFGVLNYFLDRLPDPAIQLHAECLLEAILKNIIHTKDGCWIRNYIIAKEETSEMNLSLSHGQTGFILVLLKAFEQGLLYDKMHDTIRSMVGLVLKQTMTTDPENNRHSIFPNTVHEATREKTYNNRLAWCYGDLNQAFMLYKVGSAFGIQQYIEIADLVGACSLDRLDAASTMCVDAQFCHGAAGIASMYQSLFAVSGRSFYEKAANAWIQKTIHFLEEGKLNLDFSEKELSLLDGYPAVSLVLLDAVYPNKGDWKEFFLIN